MTFTTCIKTDEPIDNADERMAFARKILRDLRGCEVVEVRRSSIARLNQHLYIKVKLLGETSGSMPETFLHNTIRDVVERQAGTSLLYIRQEQGAAR